MDDFEYSEMALHTLGKLMATVNGYVSLEFAEASSICPHRFEQKDFGMCCKRLQKILKMEFVLCNQIMCPLLKEGKALKEI